jgi:hypothetical protein
MSKGCIYCGSSDFSVEHHVPRCLGNFRGNQTLVDRICGACNNSFKLLDEQLCRSGGEAFFREYLGIQGRKRQNKANSFYRGSAGGQRVQIEANSPTDGRTIALELNGGSPRELRHFELLAEDGTRHVIPVPDRMTPEQFRTAVDQLNIGAIREGHVYADDPQIEWMQSLLATLAPDVTVQWTAEVPEPVTYPGAVITFTVTERYFRALAKIGFHFFLSCLPQFRGDEGCFGEIREFIATEGSMDRCDRFVTSEVRQTIYNGLRPANWGHLLTAEVDSHSLTARVQLFLGPESLPAIHTVRLGANPSRLHYRQAEVRYFEYFPREERAGQFDGEVKTGFVVPK